MKASDRSIIVTAAAHGIGRAITEGCVGRGWHVAAVDVDAARLEAIYAGHPNVTTFPHSVEIASVPELISALEKFGKVYDGLVNGVGVTAEKYWDSVSIEEMRSAFETNVLGPFALTRWWAERLIDDERTGSAVFVTSLHSHRIRLFPDYSMSKAAVSQMVREAAVRLASQGIRVNGLQPGAIDTWSERGAGDVSRNQKSNQLIPLGRLGNAQDLVEAALFLLDLDASSYVTGSELRVDGGLDLHNWLLSLPPEDET